jgi:threonine-phosphate decarboxylase
MSVNLKQSKFVHGDDAYRYPEQIKYNFSSNVWPGGMQPALQTLLQESVTSIVNYPPVDGELIVSRLANKLGVKPENLVLTNGATEAIYLIAQAFSGYKSTILMPAFSEYERACALFGHQLEFKRYSEFQTFIRLPDAIYWICNPNNPMGTIIDPSQLLLSATMNPNSLFVIDEAYEALVTSDCSILTWTSKVKNIIVIRSLTKSYAVPGIRVGYLSASKEVAQQINRFKPPWSVNSLALSVFEYSLDNQPFTADELDQYLAEADRLCHAINQIEGFEAKLGAAGFFLVRMEFPATLVKQQLIDNHGILVRDATSFGGLDGQFIRVACQCAVDNEKLIAALNVVSKGFRYVN